MYATASSSTVTPASDSARFAQVVIDDKPKVTFLLPPVMMLGHSVAPAAPNVNLIWAINDERRSAAPIYSRNQAQLSLGNVRLSDTGSLPASVRNQEDAQWLAQESYLAQNALAVGAHILKARATLASSSFPTGSVY